MRKLQTSSEGKKCSACKRLLPLEAYNKNRRCSDGLQSNCRKCGHEKSRQSYLKRMSNDEGWRLERNARMKAYNAKRKAEDPHWHRKYKETIHRYELRRRLAGHGLDMGTYESLRVRGCAICGRKPDGQTPNGQCNRFVLDHCHVTGKFRGLLCSKCNIGIGHFGDDVELMRKAILYLESHQE